MRNLQVTKVELTKEELKRREMSELEVYGAMLYIHQLTKEYEENNFGESYVSLEAVDSETYYSNRVLEVAMGGFLMSLDDGRTIVLTRVFCLENNHSDLFGEAHLLLDEDENGELEEYDDYIFTVRI